MKKMKASPAIEPLADLAARIATRARTRGGKLPGPIDLAVGVALFVGDGPGRECIEIVEPGARPCVLAILRGSIRAAGSRSGSGRFPGSARTALQSNAPATDAIPAATPAPRLRTAAKT